MITQPPMGSRKKAVPQPGTHYTLGYAQPNASSLLDRWMHDQRTIIIDVRYSPRSRWYPTWNRTALAARYHDRYVWERRLGNLHYRQRTLGIQLAAGHEESVQEAAALLCEGCSLILLCACKHAHTCHRSLVAKLIQDAMQKPQEGGKR